MTSQTKLWALSAGALALSLALAGCGGGGSSSGPSSSNSGGDPPPVAMEDPASPADLTVNFAEAQIAEDAAVAAGELASGALASAMENDDKLTTMEVAGDSTDAMDAADAILKAMTDAGQAVDDAQAALDDANAALSAAEDIDDDHEQKNQLIAAINDAIAAAEKALEDATAIRDGDDIANAVVEVEGADGDKTSRDVANAVGMNIGMALQPMGANDGSGMRAPHTATGTEPPADFTSAADALKFEMDDRVGHTWAEIVGETTKMRITRAANTTVEVDAASIAGMTLASNQDATDADMTEDDGLQVEATYKGIIGTAFCVGSDCVVEAVDNPDDPGTPLTGMAKFTGSWYFTPTEEMAHWVPNADETGYVADTLYAQFGYWLSSEVVSDVTQWTVNTFAVSGAATDYTLAPADATNELGDDDKATYSGTAAGMSVLKTDNAAGDGQDVDSGRFTASVMLNATFGATPMIGGYIHSFDGSAASDTWRVTLEDQALAANGGVTVNGRTVSTGADGVWSNEAYGGDSTARPTGVFGGFTAHFSDGHAAGAYATRKAD